MTKYEWFKEFRNNLKDLPRDEINKATEFYEELFEDKIDEGKSETEAVLEFGSPSIASQRIRAELIDEENTNTNMGVGSIYESVDEGSLDIDLNDEIKTKETKTKETKTKSTESEKENDNSKSNGDFGRTMVFMLELFVFGIAYFICFVTFWSVIISLVACMASFLVSGVGGTVCAVIGVFTNSVAFGFFNMGICLILFALGLVILAFIKPVVKASVSLTKKTYNMLFSWYTKNKGDRD